MTIQSITKLFLASAVAISISACTWVPTTEEGSKVTVVEAQHVSLCKKIGSTTSTVKDKVGIFNRSIETVTEELTNLAKNEAAKKGGDTLVAKGAPLDGSMSFDIYKCK